MQPEKGELVPVAALEGDLAVAYMEEPTAAQASRIAPFENGHVAILEDIFHHAYHFGRGEFARLGQFGVQLDLDTRRPAALPEALRSAATRLLVPVA